MHKNYKRITENPDKAVMFIHGILGTPNHFETFVKLVPQSFSVYNMLLDGHGKKVVDFSRTSMEKWENQVSAAVEELAQQHNEIYIVAHSMGCLLAIEQAVKNPKISKLFLLAVPLKLSLKPRMFTNSLKVYFNRIDPMDEEALAAKACYGIEDDKNPLHYIGWIPRFLELFSKISAIRRTLNKLHTPCFTFQSARDEMVSRKSKTVLTQNPNISVTELKNSGHYYYGKNDFLLLRENFTDFIGGV